MYVCIVSFLCIFINKKHVAISVGCSINTGIKSPTLGTGERRVYMLQNTDIYFSIIVYLFIYYFRVFNSFIIFIDRKN